MNSTIDNMEQVVYEAHKVKGWRWVHEQPLWVTWSLETFGVFSLSLVSIIIDCSISDPYRRTTTTI